MQGWQSLADILVIDLCQCVMVTGGFLEEGDRYQEASQYLRTVSGATLKPFRCAIWTCRPTSNPLMGDGAMHFHCVPAKGCIKCLAQLPLSATAHQIFSVVLLIEASQAQIYSLAQPPSKDWTTKQFGQRHKSILHMCGGRTAIN